MDLEATLPAWLRFYAPLIALSLLLSLGGALLYLQLREEPAEASTIIVQSGRSIVPRQLGSVAQALFQSSAVYGPVLRELGAGSQARDFLRSQVELVPIPESPTLLVIGRSRTFQRAGQISSGMAEQLVSVLNRQVGTQEFRIFGGPEPSRVPGAIGSGLVLAVGAVGGFWAGAGVAVIHYRWRRPILTLRRALRLSGATHVAILDNETNQWWRRVINGGHLSGSTARDEVRLAWLEDSTAGHSVDVQGLGAPATRERLRRRLNERNTWGDGHRGGEGSQDIVVIVASARSGEDAIVSSRLTAGTTEEARQGHVGLVWLR